MDPLTALGVATTAFKGIRKAIELGKELNGINNELGQWFGAVGQIRKQHYSTKNRFKTVEEESLDTYVALRKANDMERELKNFMTGAYGLTAWDDVVRIQTEIHKQRKLDDIRRRDKLNRYIELGGYAFIACLIIGIIIFVVYQIYKARCGYYC